MPFAMRGDNGANGVDSVNGAKGEKGDVPAGSAAPAGYSFVGTFDLTPSGLRGDAGANFVPPGCCRLDRDARVEGQDSVH